jgi:hypothetical protein
MAEMGQKYPKRLRLPAGKSAYEHMGRIVPKPVISETYSITLCRATSFAGTGGYACQPLPVPDG